MYLKYVTRWVWGQVYTHEIITTIKVINISITSQFPFTVIIIIITIILCMCICVCVLRTLNIVRMLFHRTVPLAIRYNAPSTTYLSAKGLCKARSNFTSLASFDSRLEFIFHNPNLTYLTIAFITAYHWNHTRSVASINNTHSTLCL